MGKKITAIRAGRGQGKRVNVSLDASFAFNLEPEVVTRKDARAQQVFDYVKQISDSENLKVNFSWEGDEVLVS